MASEDGTNAQAFHPIFALVIPAKAAIQNNIETTGVSTYSLLWMRTKNLDSCFRRNDVFDGVSKRPPAVVSGDSPDTYVAGAAVTRVA